MRQVLIENAEAQVLAILTLCMQVTAQGRYIAHFSYDAHVTCLSVHVYPADHDYQPGANATPVLDSFPRIGWNDRNGQSALELDLTQHQAEIAALRLALESYLLPEGEDA